MERTPSGGFSQPSTFNYATHHSAPIQAPAVARNTSCFGGIPTTSRLNIAPSSHSTSHQFYLPSASSSTSLEPSTARSNQGLAPLSSRTPTTSIQPSFLPSNSSISILPAPFRISLGNAPYGLAATSTASVPSTTPPSRSSTHGSLSCSVESSQPIELSQNSPPFHDGQLQSHSLPPQCAVPPVVTAPSHLPLGAETFGAHTLAIIMNPPDIPLYGPLFLQWLQARRGWVIGREGGGQFPIDPSILAQMFDKWLRKWWPLFHFLRLGAPGTHPSGWVGIFDFWFSNLPYEHISSPFLSQTTPACTIPTPTASDQAPEVVSASLISAPLATGSMKHYWNETSTLTVQHIQHTCTVAGGDPYAIQRLADVFPPGSVVSRDALKVGRKPRLGHHGYQEFSVLLDGRWYCLLCSMTGERSWKNQKDILNHVWNDHCDPPSLD